MTCVPKLGAIIREYYGIHGNTTGEKYYGKDRRRLRLKEAGDIPRIHLVS